MYVYSRISVSIGGGLFFRVTACWFCCCDSLVSLTEYRDAPCFVRLPKIAIQRLCAFIGISELLFLDLSSADNNDGIMRVTLKYRSL